MTVAIVAEGPTDQVLLEAATRASASREFRFLTIQPESSDAFGGFGPHGSGWKGVRRWCREVANAGGGVIQFISPSYGSRIDLLLVHVDADIASDPELGEERPCPPAYSTVERLLEHVRGWLDLPSVPAVIVLVIPSKSTEAWVVAALAARGKRTLPNVECIASPARLLTRRPFKHLATKGGQPKKDVDVYQRELAPVMADHWREVCTACGEARRFANAVAAATAPSVQGAD